MGLVTLQPIVRMVRDSDEPVLEWLKIERYGKAAGEMLAAFELIRVRQSHVCRHNIFVIDW